MTFTAANQPPNLAIGRACTPRNSWNARRRLALDLSIVNMLQGPDEAKARRIYTLPLMRVAMEGSDCLKRRKKK